MSNTLRDRATAAHIATELEPITERSVRCLLTYVFGDIFGLKAADAMQEVVAAARWKLKSVIRVGYVDAIRMNPESLKRFEAACLRSYEMGTLINARQLVEHEDGVTRWMQHLMIGDPTVREGIVVVIGEQREPLPENGD